MCHPQYVLHFFALPIWPQFSHAESMRCEGVDTKEKDQSTAPEIGALAKMPLQLLFPHGDEAADSVEQVAQNHYNTWGCYPRCIAFHLPAVPPLCISLGIDARPFIIKGVTVITWWNFGWRAASWD